MVRTKNEISIVIPVFNESKSVLALTKRLYKALSEFQLELIFVDDGSTDSTSQELNNIKSFFPEIKVLRKKDNSGIASAWKSGLKESTHDIVAILDGDLQNPPEFLPAMLQKLLSERLDAVQGIRSELGRIRNFRRCTSKFFNFTLNFFFKQRAADARSGFLITYRGVLEEVLYTQNDFYYFQNFMGTRIRYLGYAVGELETVFSEQSFVKANFEFSALKYLYYCLRDFTSALSDFRHLNRVSKPDLPWKVTANRGIKSSFFELVYFWTLPCHTWVISRRTWGVLRELRRREFASREMIKSEQLRLLKKLLGHAYRTTEYYYDSFESHEFHPKKLDTLDDLSLVPMLSKQNVRENIHFALFSSSAKKDKLHKITTSGSTGEPFVCYADQKQLEIRFASTIRALEMTGWKFGDKQLRLWHQKLGMNRNMVFKERLDALLMRRKFVPAFEMTRDTINDLIVQINKSKPMLIDGYAESLNFLAKTNLKLKYRPKAVISSAQELTESTREAIESLFGCPVIDKYGSREFSGIAYQCPESDNHHVQEESYIVEILVEGRKAQPGEVGEIVITDLNNFSVPMIRYRIGDLAQAVEQVPCDCGRETMLIGKIYGRTQALISCANGVWLPGSFFAHYFKDFAHAVTRYQVQQIFLGEIVLRIIPTDLFNDDVKFEIINGLKEFAGDQTSISVEITTEIPLLRTGKRTPVISELDYDFQQISSKAIEAI